MPLINESGISSLSDIKRKAKKLTSKAAWEWLKGGAENGNAVKYNEKIYDRFYFIPRVLNPDKRFLKEIEPHKNSFLKDKIIIAPMGGLNQFRPDAEILLLEAAKRFDIEIAFSSMASTFLSKAYEIAENNLIPSMYLFEGRDSYLKQIKNYNVMGINKLILSIDCPSKPLSYGKLDNWYDSRIFIENSPQTESSNKVRYYPNWDDIKEIFDLFDGELILKGIQSNEDIKKAYKLGIRTIWLSNHGGRVLNNNWHPVDLLEEYNLKNSFEELKIVADGGIRKGSDAHKLLILGSDKVALGRLLVYAIIVSGEKSLNFTIKQIFLEMQSSILNSGISAPSNQERNLQIKRNFKY